MSYITVDELDTYKSGFDLSSYTNDELLIYINLAGDLINDYIGYTFDYSPVINEQGTAVVQSDQQLYIKLKSTFINTVTSLKVNTYGGTYIDIPLTYINLFSNPGYFYLALSTDFYNTGRRFLSQDKLNYKVSYTKIDKGVPNIVKLATSKVVGNLLRVDYNQQNGITGSDKSIQSFTSGDYTVKLGGSSLSYQGKYNASGGAMDNPYIDDGIKALLYKLKRTRQNTY